MKRSIVSLLICFVALVALYVGFSIYVEIKELELDNIIKNSYENKTLVLQTADDLFTLLYYRKQFLLVCPLILAMLYICESIYLGIKVRKIIMASYNSYGENNSFRSIVSDEVFMRLCYRNSYSISSKGRNDVKEVSKLSIPITFHWFFGGKVVYKYTYEIREQHGESLNWHSDIPASVILELHKGKWRIME